MRRFTAVPVCNGTRSGVLGSMAGILISERTLARTGRVPTRLGGPGLRVRHPPVPSTMMTDGLSPEAFFTDRSALTNRSRPVGWAETRSRKTSRNELVLSSDSLVGQRMAVSFGIELHDSVGDGTVEVIRAGEGLVSEMMSLQVAPETLDVVQLRGIFRQPLDREPVGALGEGRP